MISAELLAFGIAQGGGLEPETFPPCLGGRGLINSIRNYFQSNTYFKLNEVSTFFYCIFFYFQPHPNQGLLF